MELNREIHAQAKDVSLLHRKRYIVAFMVFIGVGILSILRANLAIAIVSMTTEKNITIGDEIVTQAAEFNWTPFEKGLLLSCHSLFGLFGFVGGFISCKFGGTTIFGLMIFLNGILTLFSPLTVKLGVHIFLILRILEGVTYTLGFGSWMQIFVSWAPSREKFRLINFSISGYFFGVIFTFPICGYILEVWGWRSLFFITGLNGQTQDVLDSQAQWHHWYEMNLRSYLHMLHVFATMITLLNKIKLFESFQMQSGVTVIWYIIWIIFIYRDPSEDKCILPEEKRFIEQNVATLPKQFDYPWKQILSSKAVWALLNERFVEAWSLSFAVECLPSFINNSVNISISDVGLISSLPHICNFFGMLVGGPLADFLRNWKILPSSKVYTVLIRIGQLTSVALFVIMALWTDFVGSIFCMCLMRFFYGWAEAAYIVLPTDIAGEYASLVHGLSISILTFGLVLNPLLMSLLVPNQTSSEWSHYFLFLATLNLWGTVIFKFFGSGEPEPWTTSGNKIELADSDRAENENSHKSQL